jgi:dTDP-4-dehydrorhamnose reductase
VRLLVAGAEGMLGQDVLRAAERAGHEVVARGRAGLDIRDPDSIAGAFANTAPEALLNCAAWTDVDGAESHRGEAFAVNAEGPELLARAADGAGIPMLHVSSDYVFDGRPPLTPAGASRGYVESDPTGPLSVYGESKLAGERRVLVAAERNVVVRSAWLFGAGGRNFVATMLALAGERAPAGEPCSVEVVTDQVGSPTWTGHLAPALIGLIERGVSGLVHLAGGGAVSWNGLAVEAFRQAEVDCEVQGTSTAQLRRPAPRPPFSVLESERADVLPLPPWQDGLAGYLAARAGMIRP